MTARPAPDTLDRPAGSVGEAACPTDLPLRICARTERLDPALVRWEVAATVRQCCPTMSSDRLGDLVLVVNELVTNAIRYGGGGLVNVMVTTRGDGVSVRVYDGAAAPPTLKDPDEAAEDGRGLRLVDELCAHRWGHRRTPGGKYVWAHVTYGPPQDPAGLPAAKERTKP